jgi:uncharacterized protein
MKRGLSFLFVLLVSWGGWQIVQAQSGYPTWEDLYINDFAQVVDSGDESQIRALLQDLYDTTDVEATVLTINSISDYDTGDGTIESFSTNLLTSGV